MLAHDMVSHALFFVWALISPAWDTYLNSSALNLNVINVYDVAITGRVATEPNLKQRTGAGQIQGGTTRLGDHLLKVLRHIVGYVLIVNVLRGRDPSAPVRGVRIGTQRRRRPGERT